MAFTNVVTAKGQLPGGLTYETGTWNGASVTTGNITASTVGNPDIYEIMFFGASSDGDTAVIPATDAGSNILKLTFTSSDTGKYWFVGRAA